MDKTNTLYGMNFVPENEVGTNFFEYLFFRHDYEDNYKAVEFSYNTSCKTNNFLNFLSTEGCYS